MGIATFANRSPRFQAGSLTLVRTPQSACCAIVLAGGRGARMQPMVRKWLGEDRPKQFCVFVGSRSMLRHTLDRAAALSGDERVLTVIAHDQADYYRECVDTAFPGHVLPQPIDRGTSAGIFLPAAYLMDAYPKATVVILPSDHFVYPEDRFVHLVQGVCRVAEHHVDRLLLFGAEASRPETDYGWIRPGSILHRGSPDIPAVYTVRSFVEKPSLHSAAQLQAEGALWNTFIMVAKLRTLWTLGWRFLPDLMGRLETLRAVRRAVSDGRADPCHERAVLEKLYADLPAVDFSRAVLQRALNRCSVAPMRNISWCDWGRPERVTATLRAMGKEPHFGAHL